MTGFFLSNYLERSLLILESFHISSLTSHSNVSVVCNTYMRAVCTLLDAAGPLHCSIAQPGDHPSLMFPSRALLTSPSAIPKMSASHVFTYKNNKNVPGTWKNIKRKKSISLSTLEIANSQIHYCWDILKNKQSRVSIKFSNPNSTARSTQLPSNLFSLCLFSFRL